MQSDINGGMIISRFKGTLTVWNANHVCMLTRGGWSPATARHHCIRLDWAVFYVPANTV